MTAARRYAHDRGVALTLYGMWVTGIRRVCRCGATITQIRNRDATDSRRPDWWTWAEVLSGEQAPEVVFRFHDDCGPWWIVAAG